MRSLLEPLPETLAAWHAQGCPDPYVEVRHELTCTLVGTLEHQWASPAEARVLVRVRLVLDRLAVDPERGLDLDEAIRRARAARRRSIRPCAVCGDRIPPEHGERVDGAVICHGCQSSRFGVVF